MTPADSTSPRERGTRPKPILGTGRGRIIAFATVVGAVFPITLIRRHANEPVVRWAAAQRVGEGNWFWPWASFLGSPLPWLAASVIG